MICSFFSLGIGLTTGAQALLRRRSAQSSSTSAWARLARAGSGANDALLRVDRWLIIVGATGLVVGLVAAPFVYA
jgi:hypothetical protein